MSIKSGAQYMNSINRLKPNILLQGQHITDIPQHQAFRGLIRTLAALYDIQSDNQYVDKMTYPSPSTGEPVGLSFLPPKTRNDLERRRTMMSLWANCHHGFLGRSPDYMNTALMAYYTAADVLSEISPEYADNLKNYYEYCREHDITLSHAFIQPVASRRSILYDSVEDSIGAKVHDYTKDGMVVSGAFLLATQAVTSEEIFIFPPAVPSLYNTDSPYTFAFAVPSDTPGITFVCRESYVKGDSSFDYPMTSRFEEMDTLVLFDHVLVPRDRIFIYGDAIIAKQFHRECQFHTHVTHQTLCRYIAKTEFLLGLVEYMQELDGSGGSAAVYEQTGEIITILEILKSLLINAEVHASPDRWGTMVPNRNTMLVCNSYFPQAYSRMIEIVQTLGSSRLIMIPSQRDFQSESGSCLDKYLVLYDTKARDAVGLHRLAWELSLSAFAGRQIQYERFFFGGPNTATERLYDGYSNRNRYVEGIKQFLRDQG